MVHILLLIHIRRHQQLHLICQTNQTPFQHVTFHIHLVKPFLSNDDEKFPNRAVRIMDTSEFFVDSILDHKSWGRGNRYLVRFQGYPDSFNRWLSGKELENDSALEQYLADLPPAA